MGTGCINGVLDETKYSSPVPLIGLYIAAGSAVCMLFMLYDIISAFRSGKSRWIPCRLFSLNSLTLTLLAISSKIPVDLTTPMPSVYDQLAKLTGTTLICVSMGFFFPSLADQSDSEFLTNMISLAVFVITVVVNIFIQISTGVIYLFIKEHIIIMVCMCLVLSFLRRSIKDSKKLTESLLDSNKGHIITGGGSLLHRLKLCYIYGFNANPQLRASFDWGFHSTFLCCIIAFGTLVLAAFRSIIFKHLTTCQGNSDYDWSVGMIALFQILTILIGCFALTFRRLTYIRGGLIIPDNTDRYGQVESVIFENPILGVNSNDGFSICNGYGVSIVYLLIFLLLALGWHLFNFLLEVPCGLCYNWRKKRDEKLILTEYQDLIPRDGNSGIIRWIVYKASNDINRWMKVSRNKGANYLSELLSRTNPSPELCSKRSLKDLYPVDEMGFEVSSLSMALLVRISSITLPLHLSKSLKNSFDEAYEIIDFVETRIKPYKAKMKTKLAKAVLLGDGFVDLVPKIRDRPEYGAEFESGSELRRACIILRELKSTLPYDVIAEEVGAITNVILHQDHQTARDLYTYIKQMFVDMMHLFLVQFPNAIYKDVTDSSAQEFEKKVEYALKLLRRIELLEDQVNWIFPYGTGISSLIAFGVPATPPDVTQGVGMDGSSPTEGVELQACATASDSPDGLSTVEVEATQLSEIVVIQDE